MSRVVETASAFLIDSEGRFLLGLRAGWKTVAPNEWNAIGGRLEPGEAPEAALVRELWEELGVTVIDARLIGAIPEPRPDLYGPGLHHIYAVRAWTGELRNRSDENAEIRWFARDELLALPNLTGFDYAELLRLALSV